MYNGPTLTEGEEEVTFLASAESVASPQVSKETAWIGGRAGQRPRGCNSQDPRKTSAFEGQQLLLCLQKEPQWAPGCLQWTRGTEEHAHGALSQGWPA